MTAWKMVQFVAEPKSMGQAAAQGSATATALLLQLLPLSGFPYTPTHPSQPLSHHALLSPRAPQPVLLDPCWMGRGVSTTFSSLWYLMHHFSYSDLVLGSTKSTKNIFLEIPGKNLFPSKCSACFHSCKSCRWNPLVWNIWRDQDYFLKWVLVHVYSSKVC